MQIKFDFIKNKLFKVALVGGLIAFAWAAFSWTVIGWQLSSFKQFRNENEVADTIRDNAPESGLYLLPNPYKVSSGKSKSRQRELMNYGPVMFASVQLKGVDNNTAVAFTLSIISQIIAAYMIVWMLMKTKSTAFKEHVRFITLVGLLVGIIGLLPNWIWKGFPAVYVVAGMVDLVIAWFLAGLVMAKMLQNSR